MKTYDLIVIGSGSGLEASVGLTEQAAKEQGVPYTTALYDYYDTAYGSSIEDRDGFAKVLADHHSDEILGCHIIGSHASMLIQDVVNAMRMRLTTDAITQSIYVHPALPEVCPEGLRLATEMTGYADSIEGVPAPCRVRCPRPRYRCHRGGR